MKRPSAAVYLRLAKVRCKPRAIIPTRKIDAMNDNPTNKPASLDDGLIVSEFWANRRGESVRIQIRTYEGRRVIDLRKYFTNKSGVLQPTRKGLTLAIKKLPDLGISKACSAAADLGLLEPVPGHE
jgi:hypothetical protein